MKKLFVILGVLVLFVVFTQSTTAETQTSESWEKVDDKLIHEKIETHTDEYDLPPEGVSAEDAGKLITGELLEVQSTEKIIKREMKSICVPQEIITILQKNITYSNGNWSSRVINSTTTKKTDWPTITFFMIIPFLLILSFSIINQTAENMAGGIKGMGDWKLVVFYGVTILAIVVYGNSDALGSIAHFFLLLLLIIGLIASAYNRYKLLIIGFPCGVLIVDFSGSHNYCQGIMEYAAFISFAFYTSFIIAKAVKGVLLWRE